MPEFRRGVPKLVVVVPVDPDTLACRCDYPNNEAWSDVCKTCKGFVPPPYSEETYGVGWPE
jgi:hypothetical protein